MKKSIMRGTLPRTPPLVKLLDPIKKAEATPVRQPSPATS
jgi:hypothetical protein